MSEQEAPAAPEPVTCSGGVRLPKMGAQVPVTEPDAKGDEDG